MTPTETASNERYVVQWRVREDQRGDGWDDWYFEWHDETGCGHESFPTVDEAERAIKDLLAAIAPGVCEYRVVRRFNQAVGAVWR